jgi:hypothetical protein
MEEHRIHGMEEQLIRRSIATARIYPLQDVERMRVLHTL